MASNGYYGDQHGRVLGPYDDCEMGAKMRAKQTLEESGGDIYFTRADSLDEARRKIIREHNATQRR